MRLTLFFILNILLGGTMQLFLPWWSILICNVLLAIILFPTYWLMLLISFVSTFAYWAGLAFYLSMNNHHLLLQKVAHLWNFDKFIFMPLIITGCIGGIVSVIGASTGYWLRSLYMYYTVQKEI